jgi:SAM-dependent methyltransferase
MTDTDVTPADLAWWLELAPTLEWTFAKTYADTAPHEYVVLGRTAEMTREDFIRAGAVIRTFGEPGKFWSYVNIYLPDVERDVKFWTMDPEVKDTDLINRAALEVTYGTQDAPRTAPRKSAFTLYDQISTGYDGIWQNPDDLAENKAVRDLVRSIFGAYAPTVLDVGCGTGRLLDLGITAPSVYTGIDPSQGMLNELVRKHPRVKDIHAGRAEDIIMTAPHGNRRYDLVCALFAAASYLTPEALWKMAQMSMTATIYMTYVEGYLPDYYAENGLDEPSTNAASREAVKEIAAHYKGRRFRIGAFDVTVVEK